MGSFAGYWRWESISKFQYHQRNALINSSNTFIIPCGADIAGHFRAVRRIVIRIMRWIVVTLSEIPTAVIVGFPIEVVVYTIIPLLVSVPVQSILARIKLNVSLEVRVTEFYPVINNCYDNIQTTCKQAPGFERLDIIKGPLLSVSLVDS